MSENIIPIPARLKNAAQGGHVAGVEDIVDDVSEKTQQQINTEQSTEIANIKGGSTKSIANLDTRLETVEQLAEISVGGGDIGIATASDFNNPTPEQRAKVPTVGAILDGINDGIYDVSSRNPSAGPNSDGKFTLEYVLNNADTLIPTSWRKGGMTIKFVQSSDNMYVQYRLMTTDWSTTPSNWQGVDAEPTANSYNITKSGTSADIQGSVNKLYSELDRFVAEFNVQSGTHSSNLNRLNCKIPAGVSVVISLANKTTTNSGTTDLFVLYEGDTTTTYNTSISFDTPKKITFDRNVISIGFYWSSTVGASSGVVSVSVQDYFTLGKRANVLAYIAEGAEFSWTDESAPTITIKNNVLIKHYGNAITIIKADILNAASSVSGFTVTGENIKFPQTGTMYFDCESKTIGFAANTTISDSNRNIIVLFETNYGSYKSGLLTDYALKRNYLSDMANIANSFSALENKYQTKSKRSVTINGNNETFVTTELKVTSGSKYRLIPDKTSWQVATNTQSYNYNGFQVKVNGTQVYLREILMGKDTFTPLDDYIDIVAPDIEGLTTIFIGLRALSGVSVSLELINITAFDALSAVPTIFSNNPNEEFEPKIRTLRKQTPYGYARTNWPLTLLWFSDLHHDLANMKHINLWAARYSTSFNNTINCGDTIRDNLSSYDNDMNDYFTKYNGANILLAIGNHDITSPNSAYKGWDGTQSIVDMYDKYIGRLNIQSLGIVQPADAAINGYCFYYKDYAGIGVSTLGIRLIVLDTCITDATYQATQLAWFEDVLDDAKTLGYSVVIASHFMPIGCDEFDNAQGFAYIDKNYLAEPTESVKTEFIDAVDDFITAGGDFVTWLCGHTHADHAGVVPNHTQQMVIAITSAGGGDLAPVSPVQPPRTVGTKAQDAFDAIEIDTYYKQVKIVRVGYNVDATGRNINMITLDYGTKKVII